MNITVRRRTWPLLSLNQLMLGDASPAGMNLLARYFFFSSLCLHFYQHEEHIVFLFSQQATFKITLEVPSDLVALSNMPVVDEKVNGSVKVVSYQESPIMSTYLVAIVVGLFDYVEDHTSDGKN